MRAIVSSVAIAGGADYSKILVALGEGGGDSEWASHKERNEETSYCKEWMTHR